MISPGAVYSVLSAAFTRVSCGFCSPITSAVAMVVMVPLTTVVPVAVAVLVKCPASISASVTLCVAV